MRQYIPLILKKEVDQLKREIASPSCDHDTRDLSLSFDGSTRQGEAIVIVVYFLDDDWSIQQRLIKIDICEKAVNTVGLAHVLNEYLSVDYGIRGNSLLGAMKDGASVNQAVMERIKFIFTKVFNVVCFSYTSDNVGNHFQIPTLPEFGNLWIRMFSHSHKAKLLWQEQTGRKPKSYSETPWWSKWEVYQQLLVQLDDVRGFATEEEKVVWWSLHAEELPRWTAAIKQVLFFCSHRLLQLSNHSLCSRHASMTFKVMSMWITCKLVLCYSTTSDKDRVAG